MNRSELQNPYYVGDEPGLAQTLGWVDAWTFAPSVYAVAAEKASDVVQRAFWGGNYKRLLEVKRQYDPAGLFYAYHGVESESWSADGFTPLA